VAIHGLGAHPDHTWTENINRHNDKKAEYVGWLQAKDMLPNAVPNARILRFGYKSQWFGKADQEAGVVNLSSVAERLLRALERDRDVRKLVLSLLEQD
jgi:hypothetical protein